MQTKTLAHASWDTGMWVIARSGDNHHYQNSSVQLRSDLEGVARTPTQQPGNKSRGACAVNLLSAACMLVSNIYLRSDLRNMASSKTATLQPRHKILALVPFHSACNRMVNDMLVVGRVTCGRKATIGSVVECAG